MKIYIIQPMGGRTKEQILQDRELGKKVAQVYYPKAEFLNNYFDDYDENVSPLVYLSRCCDLMAQADLVIMLPFYFGAQGCDLENHIAQVYHKPRMIINFAIDEQGNYTDVKQLNDGEEAVFSVPQ